VTDEVCELVVTAPDADWLIEFGRRLVTDHLAASVHNLTPIRSIYDWQGQPHDRTESRAAIHTRTELVPRIIERLDDEHPYEVPGVFALPIVATSPAYRAWIIEQTAPRP
jgi:periplasmic divalent cation tolerance protein